MLCTYVKGNDRIKCVELVPLKEYDADDRFDIKSLPVNDLVSENVNVRRKNYLLLC